MRRIRGLLLGSGCAALVAGGFLFSYDASEEAAVRRTLQDVPEVAHEGDSAAWAWIRTAPVRRAEVEARISQGLTGRLGWSRNAIGWNYNPNYDPSWWSRIRFLRERFPDRRPILWLEVSDGRAALRGDSQPTEGAWTTVRMNAMSSYGPSSSLLTRWIVRR